MCGCLFVCSVCVCVRVDFELHTSKMTRAKCCIVWLTHYPHFCLRSPKNNLQMDGWAQKSGDKRKNDSTTERGSHTHTPQCQLRKEQCAGKGRGGKGRTATGERSPIRYACLRLFIVSRYASHFQHVR